MTPTKEQVLRWLEEVKDPEIPVLSLVDLGVITDVTFSDQGVTVELTPTFVGCPAMDTMREDVIKALNNNGVNHAKVVVSFRESWTSDKISDRGKVALKKFGLAPPPSHSLITELDVLEVAICPRCSGTETELKNPFGPTLCRSIYYCHTCKEAFEQFKPV